MCIIHSGMAYAIHIDIFIIMLLITCHNTWTELQPQCRCEFMRMRVEMTQRQGDVLYLSIIRLAHTQKAFQHAFKMEHSSVFTSLSTAHIGFFRFYIILLTPSSRSKRN